MPTIELLAYIEWLKGQKANWKYACKVFWHDVIEFRKYCKEIEAEKARIQIELIDTKRQLRRALRSVRIWRRRTHNAIDYGDWLRGWRPKDYDGDPIEDGFGNAWSAVCPDCGGDLEVVRPGKVQCSRACWFRDHPIGD